MNINTKKRITISSYDDIKNPFYAGGGAYIVHKSAQELSKKFAVTVVTGKYPNSKNEVIDGIHYKRIGLALGGSKIGQIAYQIALLSEVKKDNYDAWIESFTPPFSTSFLPFFTKKPVVGLVHMLSAADMVRKYKLPFHLIENFGLRQYKKFIVTQNQTKREIHQQNRKAKIIVIPNGVEKIKTVSAVKKHVLFIGRIEVNQKGLDLLLNAYKKSRISQKLVIAGSGEAKQISILKTLIKDLKLQSKVALVGRVDGIKKQKLLSEAICTVVPSRFETFSLVCLESLSAGVPLVSFNIPGLKWIPNGYSIKVHPFDTEKLSVAISEVTKNSKTHNTIAKKGQMYAKKFSWERVGRSYIKALSI